MRIQQNQPDRPHRTPDFCIEEYDVYFWWDEKIIETYGCDRFYLNPENWTAYIRNGEYYDLNPYLLEKYGAQMSSSYATWLLEEELSSY